MNKSILTPVIAIVLAAVVLFAASAGLSGLAEQNAKNELDAMCKTLLPGSEEFAPEEYTGEDETIRSVYKAENGYVIETVTNGYAGELTMLVGVSNDGKVTGLVVRDMEETFGLGANALSDWKYLAQYLNTSGEAAVGENVDALTGATVTSKAVTRCVNAAVGFVTGADTSSGATSWGG